jgi:hypothetical protein
MGYYLRDGWGEREPGPTGVLEKEPPQPNVAPGELGERSGRPEPKASAWLPLLSSAVGLAAGAALFGWIIYGLWKLVD